MAGSTTRSWAQYSRWVWLIGRSFWVTPPSPTERTACETFVKYFWNNVTATGTRPWLSPELNFRAVSAATQYEGDPDVEPNNFDRKMVEYIGRDLKKIPMTDPEADQCDILFVATGRRRYNMLP